MSDSDFSGGTQSSDTVRDPDLPRTDDPIRGAQEQDDSTKATAGVKLPGGTRIEGSSDGDQTSATVTIPFGEGAQKPVDTTPSVVNPDAPPDAGSCMGEDGRSYPDGWEIFKDNLLVSRCVRGIWMAVEPAPANQPGDYPVPSDLGDTGVVVAANTSYDSGGGWSDPSSGYGSDPDPSGSAWSDPSEAS